MPLLRRVLVAVDFSEASRAALRHAGSLSSRLAAPLTALHVFPPPASYQPFPTFPEPPRLDPEQVPELEQQVREFVTSAGGAQQAEVAVADGDPAEEILAQAARLQADLVVVGTHGRRGFERWALGSVTDRLVRRADRPVLAVPEGPPLPDTVRVLCALDLADASAEVLHFAGRFAEALQARLAVLHVAEGRHWYEPWPISGVDTEAVRRAVDDAASARLSDLAGRQLPAGVTAELGVRFGRPEREIERAAAEGADLVVLGVPSRHGVDRLFFGSTAQHVLRAAVCPVLLVRHAPDGAAAS
ncbi:MAG TPA: universal stress protein [Vicinamibacteria bacterium]|nr:universal stress protein [Vicinamibacteria bacterium]